MGVPALLRAIYEAYREGQVDDVLSRLDDDFVLRIHVPEALLPGGDKPRNKAEAEQVFRHLMDTYDFLAFDPGPIILTGDKATAQPHIRYRHKQSGKILETKLRHLWHIRDGRVVGLDESLDEAEIEAILKLFSEGEA